MYPSQQYKNANIANFMYYGKTRGNYRILKLWYASLSNHHKPNIHINDRAFIY